MKRYLSVFLTLIISFAFSVPVLAATDLNNLLPDLFSPDDTNSVIGTIDYLSMPDDAKSFYTDAMHSVSGQSYDTNFCYYILVNGNPNNSEIVFLRTPNNVKLNTTHNGNGYLFLGLDTPNISISYIRMTYYGKSSNNGLVRYLEYKTSTSSPSGASPYSIVCFSQTPSSGSSKICLLTSSPNSVSNVLNSANFSNFYNNTHKGQLIFKDNNPEPSEPPTPPKEPDIPQGNPTYVPYDTSYWKLFLNFIKTNIGSAVNIGFLIFAVVFGIGLCVKIVKHFSKSG